MRRFFNKRVLVTVLVLVLLGSVSAVIGLYVYLNSPQFNQRIRDFVVRETAAYTGSQVSLGSIRWNLRGQRLVLEDLTLRGTEAASEPPLGHIESITAGVRLRNLLQSHLDLSELEIVNPAVSPSRRFRGENKPAGSCKTKGNTRILQNVH